MDKITICKICNNNSENIFTSKILKKYDVSFFQCTQCKFIQTENPYWIEESYQNALNLSDTGLILRNQIFSKGLTPFLFFNFKPEDTFLDYAGGYGIFTRMMRDIGFNFYWIDKYAGNLASRGFEHTPSNNYKALTAFEVFEHLVDPLKEIEEMLQYADTIIFSTQLIPDVLPNLDWWYYGFNHGQHIAFYHKNSLQFIAKKYNLNLVSNNSNLHILTKRNISSFSFQVILKLSKFGIFNFLKLFLKSKTFSDSQILNNR
ncbi:MAG: class I SAM-dependent methyltransferase [Bacteroidota bacterium]